MSEAQPQQMRDLRDGRQVGAAGTMGYGGPAQYYPGPPAGLNPYHQAYHPPAPPSMECLPPPPPPPPNPHQVGAVYQGGNHNHPAVNRFGYDGPSAQGFANGPPRF
jgi:hypothetical protein